MIFTKTDIYEAFFDEIGDMCEWIYDAEGNAAMRVCSEVNGKWDFANRILKMIDEREDRGEQDLCGVDL